MNKTENVLEAGFFSNGDIYLLTDYDFEIFNADSTADGPVFNVGKKSFFGSVIDNAFCGEKSVFI